MLNWLFPKKLELSTAEKNLLFESITTLIEKEYDLQESYPATVPYEMILLSEERIRQATIIRDKLHNYFEPNVR